MSAVVGLLAVVLGLYFYCAMYPKDQTCAVAKQTVLQYYEVAQKTVKQYTSQQKVWTLANDDK